MRFIGLLFLLCHGSAFAQLIVGSGSKAAVATAFSGSTLPSTCTVGALFMKTGTSPGVYGCTAPNTWTGPASVVGGSETTVEIQNNAGTYLGDFSIFRFVNGTGSTWTLTDAGSGRVNVAADIDTSSLLTLSTTQTFTGKTAPDLSIGTGYITMARTNSGTTGTTINKLAKINSSGAALITGTSDNQPAWVVMSGAGTSGAAQLLISGRGQLTMDGDCTIGDKVTISTTNAGNGVCSANPADGRVVIGTADETGTGAGLYYMIAVSPYVYRTAASTFSTVRNYGSHFTSPSEGAVGYFSVGSACTIQEWRIKTVGGTTPTLTADIWILNAGDAKPTVTNTITASAKPALVSGDFVKSTTLTEWTTSVSAGAEGAVKIDAISGSPTEVHVYFRCLEQ